MTKEQAEKMVRQALSLLNITLKQHQELQEAVNVLIKAEEKADIKAV